MGRLHFRGPNVAEFLGHLATRRIDDMKSGRVRYSLLCNEEGGILDDVLIYFGIRGGQSEFLMVVNASNRAKIVDWLNRQAAESADFKGVIITDATTKTAMIAVQGRLALQILEPRVKLASASAGVPLAKLRNYSVAHGVFDSFDTAISRTGYTGEDGFEIICDRVADAVPIWERIIAAVELVGGMACGLGARDTLRLEAAMPLYGHELSEAINPLQAGLNFAVNLGGREFIGSKALEKFASDKSQPVRIGLKLDSKRVPREGCPVRHNDAIVGEVTSGTFSPTLECPIAMAYVQPTAQAIGNKLTVDIRGTQYPAGVVPLPFYNRPKKN
ncbi:MAG TPA: glycine cleavage system aminomethyltransferase GcvT, partial [Lacipirellulaceae bacterium]|nr:glycine cleavage system aminomethyltransferase GcvT [Lacipirellulaceae bacterium]